MRSGILFHDGNGHAIVHAEPDQTWGRRSGDSRDSRSGIRGSAGLLFFFGRDIPEEGCLQRGRKDLLCCLSRFVRIFVFGNTWFLTSTVLQTRSISTLTNSSLPCPLGFLPGPDPEVFLVAGGHIGSLRSRDLHVHVEQDLGAVDIGPKIAGHSAVSVQQHKAHVVVAVRGNMVRCWRVLVLFRTRGQGKHK